MQTWLKTSIWFIRMGYIGLDTKQYIWYSDS